MGVRVGAIINVNKAWTTYQNKLNFYRGKLVEAQIEGNTDKIKYWQDSISMTEVEIGEFLNIVI